MLKVGLTGGIGSGKSTVTKYFVQLKVPVIDADKIVHELFMPNTAIYQKIVAHFGKNFLTRKKTLDRAKIRRLVFCNKKERFWLERLIHPQVRAEITKRIKSLKAPYCIIVIPLFFETKFPPMVDRVLIVDCPQKIQIERACKRSGHTVKQVKAIIASQIDRKKRLSKADDIIFNVGTITALKKSVKKLHNYYLSLI